MLDRPSLRSTVVDILLGMGELDGAEAAVLAADPPADFELEGVIFDSLVVLDFCLKIETATGIVIDPDEIAAIKTLNELEGVLLGKRAS